MHEITRTIAAAKRIVEKGHRGILVTIVATRGSTYRRPGARAVIAESGEASGALSGGCIERDLAERIAPWLADFTPRLIRYDSTSPSDDIFGMGLGCRGVIDMLIEPFDATHVPPLLADFHWNGLEQTVWTTRFDGREILRETIRPDRAIAIFGGGADVEPVARFAQLLGWRASVIAPKEVHPEEVAGKVDLAQFDAAIVMTHNFLHDLALLSILLPSAIPYVGLLGPKARGEELLSQLPSVDAAARAKLFSPIGLDLGSETPVEIALSVVAEVQKVLSARSGASLRDAGVPIHEPAAEDGDALAPPARLGMTEAR